MFYLINRAFTKNNSMYEIIYEDEGSTPSWSTFIIKLENYTVNVIRENSIDTINMVRENSIGF